MTRSVLLFSLSLYCLCAVAQRHAVSIDSDWQFAREGKEWQSINLPHTYNTTDAFDDEPGYYRGLATYTKLLNTSAWDKARKYFLRFGAVNQEATVYVNGRSAGSHVGGYTSFTLEITDLLRYGVDTIRVDVDNSHNESIPPLRGDFTFYGGIYRDVQLISVPQAHISLGHHGSDGVYIDPLMIDGHDARIGVRGFVSGLDKEDHKIVVTLSDQDGVVIKRLSPPTFSRSTGEWKLFFDLDDVTLWSTNNPYLYRIAAEVINKRLETALDRVEVNYGIRSYAFDADQGFFLNGEHQKLIGVNRHQDRPGIGNALTTAHHLQDMDMITEMGANFLRTAHYPQDKSITNYCDRHGLLVSMEIPLDHEITQTRAFADVCKQMTLEMIYQYYNHPSVIIWAYMNEMGLGKKIDRDSTEMHAVAALAQELEDLIRIEDPYRYTMIPNHGDFDVYHHFGLTDIPMLVGWNLYYGWYEADFDGFGRFVDHAHHMVPDKPMLITEYGAGADPRITSTAPERFDFSLEWTYQFHKSHLEQISDRDFIAGSAVWNMFDFGSESRQDAVPHVNSKGLCSFDRMPKPVYYLYQSHLRQDIDPVVSSATQPLWSDKQGYWASHDQIALNFGANFLFTPADGSRLWYAVEGAPASILEVSGGERFTTRDRGIGSDRSIDLTDLDPVYQTQAVGIEGVRIAVPHGRYRVVVHLARLDSSSYDQTIQVGDQTIVVSDLKPFTAYRYAVDVTAVDMISLRFTAADNPTFLNSLEIFRQ